MSLQLVIGPMFSGKTTTLLSYEKKFQVSNKKYICINHSFDTRYSDDGKLSTHDGKVSSGRHVSVNSLNILKSSELDEYDAFIIDEIQFFTDAEDFIKFWTSRDKIIVCGGLNSDYRMKPFETVNKLISLSDKIVHLTALCVDCGSDAPFTERTIQSDKQTLVGTGDIYKPKCRKCHNIKE
jgi:thymidine kinase